MNGVLNKVMRSYLFKFNVLFLGSLFFSLLFIGSIILRGRLETGSAWVWSSLYFNSVIVASIYLLLFFISVFSYIYAVWRTWMLTKAETVINRHRIIAFTWLIGMPLFIVFTGKFWILMMRLITDKAFF